LDSPRMLEDNIGLVQVTNCSETEKEDLRDTLNKGYHLYPVNWRRSCKLGDVKDKLSPNVREFELRGQS
jgi:hypothetical protein